MSPMFFRSTTIPGSPRSSTDSCCSDERAASSPDSGRRAGEVRTFSGVARRETQVVCALRDDFVDVERGPITGIGSNTKPAAKRRFLHSNLFMVRILPYNPSPTINGWLGFARDEGIAQPGWRSRAGP